MKRMLGLAVASMVVVSTASATLVADFQMNDAQGLRLSQVANGTGGAQFNYSYTNSLSDGSGNIHFVYEDQGAFYPHAGLTSTNSTGIYTVNLAYSAADVSASPNGVKTTFGLNDGSDVATIALTRNNDRLRLIYSIEGGWDWAVNLGGLGNTVLNGAVVASIALDLDSAQATCIYSYDGTTDTNVIAVANAHTINQLHAAIQTSSMATSDYMDMDYVSVDYVIPEPATLGMIALVGGAIIFIRRRFMI